MSFMSSGVDLGTSWHLFFRCLGAHSKRWAKLFFLRMELNVAWDDEDDEDDGDDGGDDDDDDDDDDDYYYH